MKIARISKHRDFSAIQSQIQSSIQNNVNERLLELKSNHDVIQYDKDGDVIMREKNI